MLEAIRATDLDWQAMNLGGEVAYATDWIDRQKKIRAYYECVHKEIMETPSNQWGVDPYDVDWLRVFTPIEFMFWQDIRASGAVLYPQYPVGKYMVDFGNPKARVAIECDGKAFHQNKARDADRGRAIRDMGWSLYRISGRDCYSTDIERETEDGIELSLSSATTFIREICNAHDISMTRRRLGLAA